MSTILFPSPIFGPIHSRRLGISLGVNLLPPDGKLCSFDCIYCECGLNGNHRPEAKMPTREAVKTALEAKLQSMEAEGKLPVSATRPLCPKEPGERTHERHAYFEGRRFPCTDAYRKSTIKVGHGEP